MIIHVIMGYALTSLPETAEFCIHSNKFRWHSFFVFTNTMYPTLLEQSKQLDLMFLVDVSSGVTTAQLESLSKVIETNVVRSKRNKGGGKLIVVTYNSRVMNAIDFSNVPEESVNDVLNQLLTKKGSSSADLNVALDYVENRNLSRENQEAKSVVVIFSGKIRQQSDIDDSSFIAKVDSLQTNGVKTILVDLSKNNPHLKYLVNVVNGYITPKSKDMTDLVWKLSNAIKEAFSKY